jgi:transposase
VGSGPQPNGSACRLKKALRAAEQDRPDVAARRKIWKAAQPFIDPDKLIFLDETGVNTKMVRLYGWARIGERCRDSAPFGHWKTMTFVAGLRLSGITAPWVLDGPMNGRALEVYVRQVLAPTLRRGDILVLDNLPAHKVVGIREAVTQRRAQLFYLPPYSPDLNPIEMAFAKLKALLRQDPARTVNGLIERIGKPLECFLPSECANFFKAAGYQHS